MTVKKLEFDFNFSGSAKSKVMFHTMKDVVVKKLDSGIREIQKCRMTGLCKGLKEGSVIIIDRHNLLKCTKIHEQRNHAGRFSNPIDRVDAYFNADFVKA